MAEETASSRYVKLNKIHDAPMEEIRPGELNQPIRVPQVCPSSWDFGFGSFMTSDVVQGTQSGLRDVDDIQSSKIRVAGFVVLVGDSEMYWMWATSARELSATGGWTLDNRDLWMCRGCRELWAWFLPSCFLCQHFKMQSFGSASRNVIWLIR